LLENIYDDLQLYINFFQPSFKLIAKERVGNQTLKRYDTAKTPYQVSLSARIFPLETKARLMTCMSNSIPPNFDAGLTKKQPFFGKSLGNISC